MLRRSPLLRAFLSLALIYAWLVGGMASAIAGSGHGALLAQGGDLFEICLPGGPMADPHDSPARSDTHSHHDACCISHAQLGAIPSERIHFSMVRYALAGRAVQPVAGVSIAFRLPSGPQQPRAPPQA